ncbi:MAG: S1 RNA-binding domain-containing protein [bacterium]|nr:S1 RNA-binding domain-containing protein [bacterium]
MANKKQRWQHRQPDHKSEISDDSFEQLMAESFTPAQEITTGDQVDAKVIGFDKEFVFLDMGTRLDGVLKRSELSEKESKKLVEGQVITLLVTGQKSGAWQCSRRLGSGDSSGKDTKDTAAIMALEDAYNRNIAVEGKIHAVNKGGFEVQVMGQKAFCPISQIDRQYCQEPEIHLNQTYTFEIIRFEEEGKNLVVSRRAYLESVAKKQAEELWKNLEENAVYNGKITAIRDFGIFVDIGGIDGLLHISEISYERNIDIHSGFTVGQELNVAIKTIDREKRKIGLSLKSLMDDPWTEASKKLSIGAEFQGKVVRMKTFGAFVELFPGVDGLVHISRLGTDRRHQHPKEVLSIGETVTVRIVEIDESSRKLSLTMEKEEDDYSKDMQRLKNEQEASLKSNPGQMSDLFNGALKGKDE